MRVPNSMTEVEKLGWASMFIIALGLTFAWFLTTFSTGCGYCGAGNYSPNCPYNPPYVDSLSHHHERQVRDAGMVKNAR